MVFRTIWNCKKTSRVPTSVSQWELNFLCEFLFNCQFFVNTNLIYKNTLYYFVIYNMHELKEDCDIKINKNGLLLNKTNIKQTSMTKIQSKILELGRDDKQIEKILNTIN